MASPTDICNLALVHVGSQCILDLSDNDKRARLCKQIYPLFRDEMLRGHLWNFAIREKSLAADTVSIREDYKYSFALPADFLRFVGVQNRYVVYQLTGGKLCSDSESITLKYISRIENSEEFDASFLLALSYKIAMTLALSLADDNNLFNLMTDQYRTTLANARSMDAQENPAVVIYADLWLDSRG